MRNYVFVIAYFRCAQLAPGNRIPQLNQAAVFFKPGPPGVFFLPTNVSATKKWYTIGASDYKPRIVQVSVNIEGGAGELRLLVVHTPSNAIILPQMSTTALKCTMLPLGSRCRKIPLIIGTSVAVL